MQNEYDIAQIRAGLDDCLSLVQSPSMHGIRTAILTSLEKLGEPMQLAIIGKISSSKSTLVNAILGKNELMSTGQKEVTYNVGWLKYGKPDSDIIIHYKDDRPDKSFKRELFASLSTDVNQEEIDNISYIETFDDAEILKDINIIDTPGLDAKREKDSQNTLDFISNVRPDAVVMLFTHAVSENVLDIVRQFNAGTSFNPLNAIGVLSKIDVLWQETIPRDKKALQIGQKMVSNRKKKDLMLSKTLFDLYPISALLYLAATTVTDDDIAKILSSFENDSSSFTKSLNSMTRYLSELTTPLSQQEREAIAGKMGLYGIWLIVQRIKNKEDICLPEVKRMFLLESGASDFQKTLYNHFGSRAKLIKLESIFQHLHQEIQKAKGTVKTATDQSLLSTLEQRISDIFSLLVHEHKEYELLNKIYSGELMLDDEITDEFRNLCGENGNSAPEKLGLHSGTDIQQLLETAQQREKAWRRDIALEPDPEEREWMNVILKSYSNLRLKIAATIYQYEQAKNFLFNQ